MFKPRLVSMLRGEHGNFTKTQLKNDLKGGLNAAIISLPVAIALGISSGISPKMGIFTAIIGGLIAAIFGGSGVQITGITSGFVLISFSLIKQYGISGLAIATIMGGIILIVLGFLKMGSIIKYIPYPVTAGFTTGIGILLITTEVPSFLGLRITNLPNDIIGKWIAYIENIKTINIAALAIAILAVLVVLFWPKINKTIPSSLMAILVTSPIVLFLHLNVSTIGSSFGKISSSIPMPMIPHITLPLIVKLIEPAITIALIGSITSLLAALVGDGLSGEKHDSNTELIAQGLACIGTALFGGTPVAGVVSRTTANFKYGSRTPFGAIFNSIFLFLIMIFLMPLAEYIPLSALSGIIMILGYNMLKIKVFRDLLKGPKIDFILAITTTILIPLTSIPIAVGVAMIIAMADFMRRMSKDLEIKEIESEPLKNLNISEDILVYEIKGTLFFGTVEIMMNALDQIEENDTKVLILRLKDISNIDATVINKIEVIRNRCNKKGIKVILSGLNDSNKKILENKGFLTATDVTEAVELANKIK